MGYRCLNCGSEDSFTGFQSVTQYVTERIFMDSEGDISDYGDSDIDDSEITDGPTDVTCDSCDSSDVEWFDSEEEYEERQKEYNEQNEIRPNVGNWKKKIIGTTWKDTMEAKPDA